jgi:soluble lytic murein transglycosylase-like protein
VKRKVVSAERKASEKLQGQYLAYMRQISKTKRASIKSSRSRGSEKAIAAMKKALGKRTAFRFFGNIREVLVSLKSLPRLFKRAYGAVLFDSNARLDAPMPPYLNSLITEAAHAHGVDPRLLAAVARRESAFKASATSPVGAGGIMQLMPATAKYLGVSDPYDARQNVFAGARYLRTLLDTFDGDLDLTLAAYNAGPGAVRRFGGVPPFQETRAYVTAVRTTYEASLGN